MLTCKEVAALSSKVLDTRLIWRERWSMRVHLLLCKLCPYYLEQLRFLHKVAGRLDEHPEAYEGQPALPREARERIRRALEDNR
ncbi:MAG: zf-HC2 domain-containing protein [Acidobacteria bacterium]|nr:zf-HC2 domain-containing protein [Acidobacteriota bacterium]